MQFKLLPITLLMFIYFGCFFKNQNVKSDVDDFKKIQFKINAFLFMENGKPIYTSDTVSLFFNNEYCIYSMPYLFNESQKQNGDTIVSEIAKNYNYFIFKAKDSLGYGTQYQYNSTFLKKMSKDSMFSKPLWYGELETFNPKKYSLSSRDTLNGIINLHFLLTKKEDYFDYDTLVYSYTIPKPGSNFFSYSKIIDTIHGYKLSEINGVGKRFEFQGHDIPIRTFEISANFADTIVASEKDTLKILINRLVEFVKLDKK